MDTAMAPWAYSEPFSSSLLSYCCWARFRLRGAVGLVPGFKCGAEMRPLGSRPCHGRRRRFATPPPARGTIPYERRIARSLGSVAPTNMALANMSFDREATRLPGRGVRRRMASGEDIGRQARRRVPWRLAARAARQTHGRDEPARREKSRSARRERIEQVGAPFVGIMECLREQES